MDDFYIYNVIIPICCVLAVFLAIYSVTDSGPAGKVDLTNPATHVIVTGGSSGIGLATARMLRQKGCSVTLIARDMVKLNRAKTDLDAAVPPSNGGAVHIESADVGDMEAIKAAVDAAAAKFNGRVDVLVASAGLSRPGYLEEIGVPMYEKMVRINYLGVLFSTLAVTPYMKAQRSGRLVMISSDAGLASIIGFAGYSPSKCAVRSFAECVQMELKPYNVYTTLVSPPDVDTPMLAEEMKWKPEECKIISEAGGLLSADDLGRDIISSLEKWRFMVNTGFDGWLLGLASASITTPCPSVGRAFLEIFMAGILRFVGLVYLTYWNYICKEHHAKRAAAPGGGSSTTASPMN